MTAQELSYAASASAMGILTLAPFYLQSLRDIALRAVETLAVLAKIQPLKRVAPRWHRRMNYIGRHHAPRQNAALAAAAIA